MNAEAEQLTGWTQKDATGQPVSAVFHIVNASTRQEAENPVQKVLRSGVPAGLTNHTVLLSKNGAEFRIDDSAAPIRSDGGPLFGVVLVFRDITNQRHAEEARARLAAIVESSEDAIISENLEGIIQTWNIGAERLFGYEPEEIIGKSVSVLVPHGPLDEEELILGRIRQSKNIERIETMRVAKDGRNIPVVLSVSQVKDDNGQVIGASQILHDATEIVAAREKLARGRDELERVVKERTAKLQEMVTELQHVSYSITHDMRAPLRAMSAFAEMLLDDTSPSRPSPEEAKDYCRRIVRAAHRLDQLIVDALSYTRVVLQDVSLEPVSVTKIVRDLMDVYPHLQSDRADIQIEGTLPTVLGNESLLTQCFSNLLGNAVKFVAPGARPKVRLRAESNGQHARIWVEDSGIGIPQAAQKRLFGMYEKLDNRYEGTGIGLALVRKVVERMGGTVGAESEPGQGSRFWVDLTLVPDQVMTPFQDQPVDSRIGTR
jgi:PAS domain S-box-containing protein